MNPEPSFSIDSFDKTVIDSLRIPVADQRMFRRFLEEKRDKIVALWFEFLEEATKPKDDWTPLMMTRIQDTSLSNLAKNVLSVHDITMLGHLTQRSAKELLGYRALGRKTLKEIQDYLGSLGLELASD